ncbi:cytochrome c-type biogenesis protein [Methanolinea mesophila]|uniref:cytochrome c biogenesis CcdA family protein n=1 Tax=Methanolinea mesophila TaxID=547055 RepID=UPI001AE7BCEE|nr:cytochrome c-type biogenesis protein [Methanolinea mesophila]
MDDLSAWGISFVAGVLAPLTSPCVLPLYPGFIAFLSRQTGNTGSRFTPVLLGLVVTAGVLLSMAVFGVIVSSLFAVPLSRMIGIISPVAFGVLAVAGLLLILGIEPGIPVSIKTPRFRSPYPAAFGMGLFFGIVILPCNAISFVVLIALATTFTGLLANLTTFIAFGLGMAVPLFLIAALSARGGPGMVEWVTRHKRGIDLVTGIILLGISLYFLAEFFGITPG